MARFIHHLGLNAYASGRIAALYEQGLGFVRVMTEPNSGAHWLKAPNVFVQIRPSAHAPAARERARRVCDPGLTHFCVQAHDGWRLWDELHAAGLEFNSRPIDLQTGAIYAYGKDEEFNVIEAEGVSFGPDEQAPWVGHVAIATPDIKRATAFYEDLLESSSHAGGRFGPSPAIDAITGLHNVKVEARWIRAANLTLELWQYLEPATKARPESEQDDAPGYRRLAILSDDVFAESDRRAALSAPSEENGLIYRSMRDPDGNVVRFLQSPPQVHELAVGSLPEPDIVAAVEARRDAMKVGS